MTEGMMGGMIGGTMVGEGMMVGGGYDGDSSSPQLNVFLKIKKHGSERRD